MKKTKLYLSVLFAFALITISCKNDKKDEAKNGAEPTAEMNKTDGKFVLNDQSVVHWKGTKPMGEHIGTIAIESGEIYFKNGTPESGKITIDMTSISVKDEDLSDEKKTMLENHLKGTAEGKEDDFFNTSKFPTATFEITGSGKNDGKTILEGNLTIREKTHAVAFPVEIAWASDGSSVKLTSEKFEIDRTKWGVNYGSKTIFDNLGNNWVSDEMELEFSVKASRD